MLSKTATFFTLFNTITSLTLQNNNNNNINNDNNQLLTSKITLKSLNIIKDSVTVSGLSSGAYMAVQMHVAFSSLFQGVAVYAGGPYYCALGSLTLAQEQCMYGLMGGPQTSNLITYTKNQASKGTIDATSNMADDKIFIFSGSKDTTVYPKVVKTLEDYYAAFVSAKPVTKYDLAAQHCIPTLDYGETCGVKMSPYIGDCSYDGAGAGFQTLYDSSLKSGTAISSNLYQFDQTEFFTGTTTSINDFGYIYIPTACADGANSCRLHVAYHGCLQDYSNIGDVWAVHAGYNTWAEANNIVVVYPYAKADKSLGNPNACWDWWGYTGEDYVLQSGVQMAFSKKIVDRIIGDSFTTDDDTPVVTDDTPETDDADDTPVVVDDDAEIITLKSYNITADSVTVSGLSSGAYMAVQMHVAFSSLFKGVGVFAGGPYYCALGSLTIAEEQCMYGLMGGPQTSNLITYTKNQASKGTIDATSNMASHKVYIFSGSKDTTVYPKVVKTLEDYYGAFLTTPSTQITTKYNLAAQHCIPTLDYGETCGVKMSPYIGDCSYDGAGAGFQTLYGSSLKSGTAISSNLYVFDQTEFFTGTTTSINSFGYIYIPTACKSGSSCRLHVAYHGCLQDYSNIGDVWAVHAGYNTWAEANNIIVVYPYAKPDRSLGNPNACWDWWGYTGEDYVLQSGVQMAFSKKILDRLMGK